MKELNSYTNGYNCDWGGSSTVVSEATKEEDVRDLEEEKTSNRKGKKNSDESNAVGVRLSRDTSNTEHHRKESKPGIKARRTPNQRSSVLMMKV